MPRIAADTALQTVLTTFEVNPGTCDDLLEDLSDVFETFVSRQPGFVAAALHVNDARTRIAAYSQWEKREDFLAMLRSPEMRTHGRRFATLSRAFEPVMYEVARTFGSSAGG